MREDYLRFCLLIYSLQNELADILYAVEAGEILAIDANKTAMLALDRTLRALSRSVPT